MTLRNRTVAEVNRRFTKVQREITRVFSLGDFTDLAWPYETAILLISNEKKIKPDNSAGRVTRRRAALGSPSMIFASPLSRKGIESNPNPYVFQRNPENIARFESWLDAVISAEILQPTIPLEQRWLSSSLGTGYISGVASVATAVLPLAKKQGISLPANSPFTNPKHIERAKLIYTRNFNGMQGITDSMKSEMKKILADGIIRGNNPRDIAVRLNNSVHGIGKVRARRIARTEIVEAHQEAAIAEAEELESQTGFKIDMKWRTALDGRERDSHRARHNKIYTKEVARTLLGEPNCRCALIPNIVVN